MTGALHVTLASRWLDPAQTEALITPLTARYAIHDGLVKPMPGNKNAPSLAASWSAPKGGLTSESSRHRGGSTGGPNNRPSCVR
jgi:peptide/nickel transport system substrate-binding protein